MITFFVVSQVYYNNGSKFRIVPCLRVLNATNLKTTKSCVGKSSKVNTAICYCEAKFNVVPHALPRAYCANTTDNA